MTAPGLLLASKQLYVEANSIYYQRACFRFDQFQHAEPSRHKRDMYILAHWLSRLSPAARQSLKDVQVEFLVLSHGPSYIEAFREYHRKQNQLWLAETEELLK